MLQNIGRNIRGVVYHPVWVHVVEVVLEVGQKQGTHAHRVEEHILSALNVKEADIDPKADEPIRTLNLMGAYILSLIHIYRAEAIPIASDIKTSHSCCLSLALVFDTTSPSAGAVSYTHLDVYKRQP